MTTATLFKKILVPIDFTAANEEQIASGHAILVDNQYVDYAPASKRSIEIASSLARLSGGQLLLLHVTPELRYHSLYAGASRSAIGLSTQALEEIHKAAHDTSVQALKMMATEYCQDLQVIIDARPGVPYQVIMDEADRFEVDLIVLAASGRSRVARFFVGSTADRIIRTAHCPVLVIPTTVD